ncbi:hypothetical protein [Dyella subtropica]|uniref:hypothetical protein n=1 Tax=Dyella subtropica TaxID=2992127 RepID=UPI002258BBE6|nr:hypothetical protein [Dyella subtropica]
MRSVLAFIYYLLALVGCTGGSTTEIRSSADGRDVVHGRVHVQAGLATFECLGSASGQCHFVLFPAECGVVAAVGKRCQAPSFKHLALAVGTSQELGDLPAEFKTCVVEQGGDVAPDCLVNGARRSFGMAP